MTNLKDELKTIDLDVNTFKSEYVYYITNVSNDKMAVSLETINLLCKLCLFKKPKLVLDLGSGFSTYVIHKLKQLYNLEYNIISVDDSYKWLDKTKDYLDLMGIKDPKIFYIDDFLNQPIKKFDMIFYDLSDMKTRQRLFKIFYDKYKLKDGIVLLDDIHKLRYKSFINLFSITHSVEFISFEKETIDSYERYSGVLL